MIHARVQNLRRRSPEPASTTSNCVSRQTTANNCARDTVLRVGAAQRRQKLSTGCCCRRRKLANKLPPPRLPMTSIISSTADDDDLAHSTTGTVVPYVTTVPDGTSQNCYSYSRTVPYRFSLYAVRYRTSTSTQLQYEYSYSYGKFSSCTNTLDLFTSLLDAE